MNLLYRKKQKSTEWSVGKTGQQKARRRLFFAVRRARVKEGYLPSFLFDTHVAQLVGADVFDEQIGARQSHEQDGDDQRYDKHRASFHTQFNESGAK